ncbi:MAG: response regulator [Verrucomicrobia bacterium]|nr:response regulator [Verrucomicrobiota bacterium]
MTARKVLVVDDETGFSKLLQLNLESTGSYEVKIENQGARAAESAKWFKPDVILLDVIMPDISGREVSEQVRAIPELRDVPIIFITAAISREEAEMHGGTLDGYPVLSKPAKMAEVLAAIEKSLAEG